MKASLSCMRQRQKHQGRRRDKAPQSGRLKAEYRKLDEEKERLYQKYGEVKKELADYGIIKQNVDSILRVTPHQERTQEL